MLETVTEFPEDTNHTSVERIKQYLLSHAVILHIFVISDLHNTPVCQTAS